MTIYVTVTDDQGNELGFDDIPVHCMADGCEDFVDSDKAQVRFSIPNWSFKVFMFLCPRHLGMAVGYCDLLDENGNVKPT